MKYLLFIILGLLTIISCYKVLTLETSDQEIIDCHDNNGNIKGDYYVISEIDSLQGDEISISKDDDINYYNYLGNSKWEIKSYKLKVYKKISETYLESDLYFLNGRVYVCKNILLLEKVKLLEK